MTAKRIPRQIKPDTAKNVSSLDDIIQRQMWREKRLIPVRINKTTIVLRNRKWYAKETSLRCIGPVIHVMKAEYTRSSIIHDCTCPNPNCFVNGKPEVPRRPHAHISADLIKCPYPQMEMRDFIFNGIDEETLIDIENSTYHLEIVREKGDQLSLF